MKIKYTNSLTHMNDAHDPKTGQFTFKKGADIAAGVKKGIDSATPYVEKSLKGTKGPRADLSNVSNQELRTILERERMEQEYDRYFNTPTEKKGAKWVTTALSVAGGIASVAIAGLTIADKMNKMGMFDKKPKNYARRSSSSDMNFFSTGGTRSGMDMPKY